MSAETYLAVRCDHQDGDGERCDTEWSHPTRVDTHRELRRHLKTRGWRFGRHHDLCPDHAAA
ncbi:hypothetical protein [Kitasatospora sp. NPDC057223]|uniref:hypothetical protein n=1 Tax=Kitasatospora sp. NPDC057223 TaxID=3346055 RepID=UPI00363FCC36